MFITLPNEALETQPIKAVSDEEQISSLKAEYSVGAYKTIALAGKGVRRAELGYLYPRKGSSSPNAIKVNNLVKKLTLAYLLPFAEKELVLPIMVFLLMPFKIKVSWFNKFLENYYQLADSLYRSIGADEDGKIRIPYLKREMYNPCSQELWGFWETFLTDLGINKDAASYTGKILATLIEYEDIYRLNLEDTFTETSKEQLLANPRKEISRLMRLIAIRGNIANSRKFEAFGKLLNLGLLHPKIKRAFKKAMSQSDFKNLQLDEIDWYYCLQRQNYNYFGETNEVRWKKWVNMHRVSKV